jgi:TRAP-type mannitol/chloroaromatic compound transport system substrate-binding protein
MGGWFRKEIKTLEDFKGLKFRMPGLGGEVMNRLGASAVAIPGGEIFTSLQSGTIDATEWVGPWNDLAMGFYQVAKFYYWPGFHEPSAALCLGTNLDVWNDLTPGEKRIIQDACAAEDSRNFAEFNAHNTESLRVLVEEHGVQLRQFSDEIMAELGRVSEEVVRRESQGDDLTRRIYESFLAARARGAAWSRISDYAYMAARRLTLPDA